MKNFRDKKLISKLFFIMKTSTVLLMCVFLQANAAEVHSQRAKVTINTGCTTLSEVLDEMENQTQYLFFYNNKNINTAKRVKVNVKDTPVSEVLDEMLGEDVAYTLVNNHIILSKKEDGKADVATAIRQQAGRNVTGTVVDTDGEPVVGANVTEKGVANGIVTDADGRFSLNVFEGATLVVSYIGYVTQEVAVGNFSSLQIVIEEDTKVLEEVVVVGYGTVQRRNFTGSVSTIKVAESPLALTPRTNSMDMLRGNVTGTTVSRETDAGGSPSIQIHGQKSVNGSSTPLVVLDGMIFMGGLRDIDPNTIESMSVLKDASSLAAYGSQAANGVIMITTKKGLQGKPVISFSSSLSSSRKTMMPKLLSPEDFVAKTNYTQGTSDPKSYMGEVAYENYLAGRTTDWNDYGTQDGFLQQYSLSVSGATEKLNYYMSISHTDQKGILVGDQYKREALLLRLQNDITSWLQVGTEVNYAYNNYDGTNASLKPFFSPYLQPTRPNGMLERFPLEVSATFGDNPLWNTQEAGNIDDRERYATGLLKGHVLVKAPWVKGLSYRMNISYSEQNYRHDQFTHEGHWVPDGPIRDDNRYSQETQSRYLSNANGYNNRRLVWYYVWDNILNYTAQFGKHYVDATAVYTRDQYINDERQTNGNNFSALGNSLLGYNGLQYADVKTYSTNITRKANVGYLGRIHYNFDERYHFNFSVRRDGSSVFGANRKWGIFPAAGVAWTVSRESFMENVSTLDFLKLKASWGKNGNQSLNPYGTLSLINLGQSGNRGYAFDNNSSNPNWGEYLSAIGNSELGWETTTAFNAGVETGLMADHIRFELNVYKSQTTDQIFDRTIPVMTNGFTSTKATMGQVDNWGVEFTLNTVNLKSRDFEWASMLNFYLNRNKLVDLYGDGKDDLGSSLFIGKSLGAIYGYKVIGIVQEEDTEYMAANGVKAGTPKYANIDESADGRITMEGDRTILGYSKENFFMNMAHTFRYHDWELWTLFAGVFSGREYGKSTASHAFITNYDVYNNLDHTYWTPENRNNTYPNATYSQNNYVPLLNYGFVRLQDLSLSYTFRQQAVRDRGIRNLKVYLAAKNLFTLTDWVGGDPENKQKFEGVGGYNTYPLARSYSLGLNLSF
jgi:TonB-linked SusC/RagA family outer membrane protein